MIEVSPAESAADLDLVYKLTHDAWVDEGLIEPRPSGRMIRHPELDNNEKTIVLLARDENGTCIGTNSITMDSPLGLPMDHGLKDQVDSVRAQLGTIAGSWRIATAPVCRSRVSVLSALIIKTIDIAESWEVDSCLFLFAMRHERIYQKLIGARTICHRPGFYSDAPLWTPALMRVDRGWFGKGKDGYEGIRKLVRRGGPQSRVASSSPPHLPGHWSGLEQTEMRLTPDYLGR